MKCKALRYKAEANFFKEFVMVEEVWGKPTVITSELPKLQPKTATLENMKKIFEENDIYHGLDLDFDKLELVELDVIESGEVGADIRNKLLPLLNLTALIKLYLKESDEELKIKLKKLIEREIENSERSIKYITNLL